MVAGVGQQHYAVSTGTRVTARGTVCKYRNLQISSFFLPIFFSKSSMT